LEKKMDIEEYVREEKGKGKGKKATAGVAEGASAGGAAAAKKRRRRRSRYARPQDRPQALGGPDESAT